jgi:hypothetical protein
MRNKILATAAVALFLSSCGVRQEASWFNLPEVGTKHALYHSRGALIVNPEDSNPFDNMLGELLYIADDGVISLENKEGRIRTEDPIRYKNYDLHILRPKTTTAKWSMPTSPLLFFTHGWFGLVTVPLTWVTSSVNAYSERHAYKLEMETLSIEQIRAQCRFPMGIPEEYVPNLKP